METTSTSASGQPDAPNAEWLHALIEKYHVPPYPWILVFWDEIQSKAFLPKPFEVEQLFQDWKDGRRRGQWLKIDRKALDPLNLTRGKL